MKKRLFIFFCSFFCCHHGNAQSYINTAGSSFKPTACDSAATRQVGSITKDESGDDDPANWNNDWDKSFIPDMTKKTDKLVELVKETFPGLHGFKAMYQRYMHKGTFVKDGPRMYNLRFAFFVYSCIYDYDKQTHQSVPTGKFANGGDLSPQLNFSINSPDLIFQQTTKILIDGKMRNVYTTFGIMGTWKGCTVFGNDFFSNQYVTTQGNVSILITRKNEKAFRPITRKQYLEGKLAKYDEDLQKDTAHLGNEQAAFIKRYIDEHTNKTKIIMDYLAGTSADSLALPAIVYNHSDMSNCEDWFNPKKMIEPPVMFVYANHDYWHTNEDKASPQLISVKFLYKEGSWYDMIIKKQFEKNFPVEKFQELLDK